MKRATIANRSIEILALAMIGEGALGLIQPERYLRFWRIGPKPLRDFIDWLIDRPDLVRALSGAEVAFGLWLALREIEPNK